MPNGMRTQYYKPRRATSLSDRGRFTSVWAVLYPIILGGFGYVALKVVSGVVPVEILIPVTVNLLATMLYAPLYSRWHRRDWALVDLIVIAGSLVWYLALIWPLSIIAAAVQVPYLVWSLVALAVMTATVRSRRPHAKRSTARDSAF